MARAKTALAWGGQWQRLHSLKEGVAGAKTVLPRGGAGRGKDCAPSGKEWQGQRLCSLGKGVAAAKTMLPRGREWQGQRLHSLREGVTGQRLHSLGEEVAGAKTALPRGRVGGFIGGHNCLMLPLGSFLSEVYGNLPADSNNITAVKKDKKP